MTLLVVDDDPGVLAIVAELARASGACRVWATATSGEDALSLLAARDGDRCGSPCPDVVLIDVELPGIDGIDTARRHLADHPGARVVLMSSHARDDLPADLLAGGVAGFVAKVDLTPAVLADLCTGT